MASLAHHIAHGGYTTLYFARHDREVLWQVIVPAQHLDHGDCASSASRSW
jgi:hypothetical protein